jgi:AmmeMemoRadiSam system protein B
MRRRTAVAGTWYPDRTPQLVGQLDRYLAEADVGKLPQRPRAIIAPHAGLMYSGPVAAFAYKVLTNVSYHAAVLVGPSHFVPFRGVALWAAGCWDTPLGEVEVEQPLAESIRVECEQVIDLPAAHAREHSLEMQLPFVAHVLPGVPIVPLVMGDQTRETAFALGDALARVLRKNDPNVSHDSDGSNVLLIASSDLSHYESADVAARMDSAVIRHVEALDPDGLMDELELEPRHACGGGPMVAVLHAARQLGARESRVLRYADSGDVSGDKSSVVGYLAAAVS